MLRAARAAFANLVFRTYVATGERPSQAVIDYLRDGLRMQDEEDRSAVERLERYFASKPVPRVTRVLRLSPTSRNRPVMTAYANREPVGESEEEVAIR